MSYRSQLVRIAAMCLSMAAGSVPSRAQVLNSAARPISLQAVLNDSITVNLSGNAVNFNLVRGSANNAGDRSITATTIWTLTPLIGFVRTYAYFSSSAAALSDGTGNNIPSADFQISNNGGGFQALTTTVPFGGANAGLRLFNQFIFINNRIGTHTDVMNFNINLAGLPNLPASNYTGILNIQAQAF